MKKRLILFLFFLYSIFISCEKKSNDEPIQTTDTTHQQVYHPPIPGKVIFYLKSYPFSEYGSGVDVWLNWINPQSVGNYLGRITNIPSDVPYCGSWWGKNYSDTTSSHYTYHAKIVGNPIKVWDGDFQLAPDTCIKIELSNE
jgi:hypothetical protein